MTRNDVRQLLEFTRKRTTDWFDALAKRPDAAAALGWRPGPGRAHIGWQLMHIAATDDRHLGVRMKGGEPANPEYVRRFAGGSTPDEQVPKIDEIRHYLAERRAAMLDHLASLTDADLPKKPNEQAPWPYETWFQVLVCHEAHHQGQAHLTLNLYKAAHGEGAPHG
ncbi:MAG TPA: DinB family protein [Gemmataceae bacterium]|nr:DinB family protein [Gemmataceae bacterium]